MKKLIYILLPLLVCCTKVQKEEEDKEINDPAAIELIKKNVYSSNVQVLKLPIHITKKISGPGSEKYEWLGQKEWAQNTIRFYSWDLGKPGNDDKKTILTIQRMNRYIQEAEQKLMEGHFADTGTFYEATCGHDTYWMFVSNDGEVVYAFRLGKDIMEDCYRF